MRDGYLPKLGITACLGLVLTSLAGCSSPVAVTAPETSAETSDICLTMSRQLPDLVNDQTKRSVQPLDIRTAAWGDPPIVYRCGVSTPETLTPTSTLVSVNNVDWLPVEHANGTVFTTVKRKVNIEITVPSAYAPAAAVLVDFSSLIQTSDPINLS